MNGFSLHAAVRRGFDDGRVQEQLGRYNTLPALANTRVHCDAAGQMALKPKTP